MKKIGHRLVKIGTGEVVQEWVGDWDQCPGLPSFVVLPDGRIVEGISAGVVIHEHVALIQDEEGKEHPEREAAPLFQIVPVMGSPERRHVDSECGRRITQVLPLEKQLNRQAAHLSGTVTEEYRAVSVAGWDWIEATRQAARDLKNSTPIPDDFTDDAYWPEPPAELADW